MTDGVPPPFELYKLSVEMADRISARRGTANGFFLTLHTGLAGSAGLVTVTRASNAARPDDFGLVITALVGLILCAAWWLLIRSYRLLNTAKFRVISEIEEGFNIQPFKREWTLLKEEDPIDKKKPRYAELNVVEQIVPIAFAFVYVALAVRATFL